MKTLLLAIISLLSLAVMAQEDYSGHYGYSESLNQLRKYYPGVNSEESGNYRSLLLLHVQNNQYRFWISVCNGYPAYHSGEIEGIINFRKDSAVFFYKDSVILYDCRLVFKIKKTGIFISDQQGNCGFGANVTAYGDYPKLDSKKPTSKDLASFDMFTPARYRVSSNQATIYVDTATKETKGNYFIKGDIVYVYEEEKETVFIKHITRSGKYIEGWLKKSDLKIVYP